VCVCVCVCVWNPEAKEFMQAKGWKTAVVTESTDWMDHCANTSCSPSCPSIYT